LYIVPVLSAIFVSYGATRFEVSQAMQSNPRQGQQCHAYIIGRIYSGKGAFEPAHLLAANIGLAVVSTKKIIIAILNCG
jgi:hypothetical protein